VIREGQLPIVAVAGLRGKTTVIRLLDHIMRLAGHRTALWTSNGVEINGRAQAGEIGAWRDALRRCVDGDVSVVFQELDSTTVLATGLPVGFYPIVTITNLCGNDEVCQIHRDAQIAIKTMPRILQSASPDGVVVLNGDEFSLVDAMIPFPDQPALLYTLSRQAPLLRQHLAAGGIGAWRDGERLHFGDLRVTQMTSPGSDHGFTVGGEAAFQVNNVLAAISTARAMGASLEQIDIALQSYQPNGRKSPGTFTIANNRDVRVVVDRPNPSWFLRPILRSLRPHARGRLIVVAGRMDDVPLDDIEEVGRMLGRDADALILHTHHVNPERVDMLLKGVSKAIDPPMLIRVASEGRGIGAALRRAHPRDTVLVLADNAERALQIVQRSSKSRNESIATSGLVSENFQDSI
jgi:cyanophycin synthetase